jgi:hypothetical protein
MLRKVKLQKFFRLLSLKDENFTIRVGRMSHYLVYVFVVYWSDGQDFVWCGDVHQEAALFARHGVSIRHTLQLQRVMFHSLQVLMLLQVVGSHCCHIDHVSTTSHRSLAVIKYTIVVNHSLCHYHRTLLIYLERSLNGDIASENGPSLSHVKTWWSTLQNEYFEPLRTSSLTRSYTDRK